MTAEKQMTRAILHIPHSLMLLTRPFAEWVDKFEKATRTSPTEVALPAIDYGGTTFESAQLDSHAGLQKGNLLPDWVRLVHERLGDQVPIWASVIPAFEFLADGTVMLQDQYGYHLDSQACIRNPIVQQIISDLFDEIAAIGGITGVVIDLTDIYPNSGSSIIAGIQNTCFCQYCVPALKQVGWVDGAQPFVDIHRNISRLVLKVNDSGTAHIDVPHELISRRDNKALMQLSLARGFVADASAEDASKLLDYLAARGLVTATSVATLGLLAKEHNFTAAVILGDENFDLTQCISLRNLVDANAVDECWLPSMSQGTIGQNCVKLVQYLCDRSTYSLNAFFELADDIRDQRVNSDQDHIGRLVERSIRTTRSSKLTRGAIAVFRHATQYSGFVGVPLTVEDTKLIIDTVMRAALTEI